MSLFRARYELTKAVMDREDTNHDLSMEVAKAADAHRDAEDSSGEERIIWLSTADLRLHRALEQAEYGPTSRHIEELRDIVMDELEEDIQ